MSSTFYKIIFLFFLLVGSTTIFSQTSPAINYVISGTVANPISKGEIILSQFDPISQAKTQVASTTLSVDGSYELTYTFVNPDLFRIDFFGKQSVMLVIGEGQNNIQLDVAGERKGSVAIMGSPDSEKLLAYDNFRLASNARVVKPTYQAMRAASKENNQAAEIEAVMKYADASEVHRKELIDFTIKEVGTSLALYGSMLRWTGDEEIEKLETLVQNFKKVHPNLKMTKVMEDKVERFKRTAVGAITPPIALLDMEGNAVTLDAVKGKYTLIDFWASWCSPCILQIPDLHDAYKKFHAKGFEIVGVSIDNKEDRWKKAITKHQMNWPQLSDLKGWASQAAADYNVTFIPFNLLIDGEGKIIAKNLHSKALESMLTDLLP